MLGKGAFGNVVATGLPAFLGQDAGADDFAGFLPDYHDGTDPVGLFGVEGPGEGPFGDPFPGGAVWPDGGWPDAVGEDAGGAVGSGDRFVQGVNQASYFFGDARFRVNCLEACVAFHNSVKFGRQFVAGPAGDRDPARLEAAFGATARRVAGVAGAERYVRSMPVGVTVPVIYQRADGSAHVIAAVRAGDGDGVDLLDAQKGEVAEAADVLAAAGVWVIPVPGAEVEGEVVLPPSGSGLRREDGGSGLPAEVTGPKRRRGVSGPVARKAGTSAESSRGVKRRKVEVSAAVRAVSGSRGDGGSEVRTPTDQAAQQDPSAERKWKQKETNAKHYQARKAAVARVAELEALRDQGPLTVEQEAELVELQPKAQQWQKKKDADAACWGCFRQSG